MNTKPLSPEGRQHISLSQYAYSIVRSDSLTFLGTINYSGFINRIVINSMLDSFDEPAYAEEERITKELTHYSKPGKTIRLNNDDREMVNKIASAHRNFSILSFKRYPKDISLKIRLNKDLHEIMYPLHSDWEGSQYDLSQGDYIKLLVEEYARKTIYDRERIFFKSLIEDLGNYIDVSDDNKRRILLILSSGDRFIMKTYRLSNDYEADYNYIIGMAAKDGTKDFMPASFRISRIAKIVPRSISAGSGRITDREKKEIERKIKDSGVSFIVGEPIEHKIKLTPQGLSMYNTIFHQRPIYDQIERIDSETVILTFTATIRQITNYFFTFAKEAEIISPVETRDWMKNRYRSAFESYNDSV